MRGVMSDWKARFLVVGDVRGLGPMMLVEFVRDRASKEPFLPEETLQIVRQVVADGVVAIGVRTSA
jgi:4-aminobutyrate aminotransferase/(S)-3-amino-2-methylpropionate transaminase